MKKAVTTLILLLIIALGLMLLLVKGSDPDRSRIPFHRDYSRFAAIPAGSLPFPGKVSLVKVVDGTVFGYVHKNGIIYKFDPGHTQPDTFMRFPELQTGALAGFDADLSGHLFYYFTAKGGKIFVSRQNGILTDSIFFADNTYVKGIKALAGNILLFQVYDPVRVVSRLKLAGSNLTGAHLAGSDMVNGHSGYDTLLYEFPHFDDGGISADGFFIKQPATGDLYFIPYYNSYIIRYNQLQNRLSRIITIDSTRPANIALRTNTGYSISSKAILINSAATADHDHLYVLSYALARANERKNVSIDIYATADGGYEGSLLLEAPPTGAVLSLDKSGDTLFVSSSKNVFLYKLTMK